MPNPEHRNGNGNGSDRDRADRDRDRPDRDRGAWDDQSRYMELAPGHRDDRHDQDRARAGRGHDEDRRPEEDHGGRIGRAGEDDRMRGTGYGSQQGYGGGQSGYAAGYSGQMPRGQGQGQGSTGYGGGGNTGYEGGMGYGSQGSGADTFRQEEHRQMGGQRQGRQEYARQGEYSGQMGGWSPGQEHQQREQGQHRGKGPVGYARSDERIREDVCDVLTDDDRIDATGIEVTVKSGEVTLTGHVPDRRTKRLAEDRIEAMSGVKDVCNNLRCSTDPNGGSSPQAKGASGKT